MKKKEKANDSLKDFYRFQLREQRRHGKYDQAHISGIMMHCLLVLMNGYDLAELLDLQQKVEEDKR